jgi:hypothetical protein
MVSASGFEFSEEGQVCEKHQKDQVDIHIQEQLIGTYRASKN